MPVLAEGAVDPTDARTGWWLMYGDEATLKGRFPCAEVVACTPEGYGGSVYTGPHCQGKSGPSFTIDRAPAEGVLPCVKNWNIRGDRYHGAFCSVNFPYYRHFCREATYNPTEKKWTCTAFGPRCGVSPCFPPCNVPVPPEGLSVFADDPVAGQVLRRADEQGNPIGGEADEIMAAGLAEPAEGGSGLILLGVGAVALLFLLTR